VVGALYGRAGRAAPGRDGALLGRLLSALAGAPAVPAAEANGPADPVWQVWRAFGGAPTLRPACNLGAAAGLRGLLPG
jgi:hypothetical protein